MPTCPLSQWLQIDMDRARHESQKMKNTNLTQKGMVGSGSPEEWALSCPAYSGKLLYSDLVCRNKAQNSSIPKTVDMFFTHLTDVAKQTLNICGQYHDNANIIWLFNLNYFLLDGSTGTVDACTLSSRQEDGLMPCLHNQHNKTQCQWPCRWYLLRKSVSKRFRARHDEISVKTIRICRQK